MLVSEVMDDLTDAEEVLLRRFPTRMLPWPLWYWRQMQLQLSSSQEAAQ